MFRPDKSCHKLTTLAGSSIDSFPRPFWRWHNCSALEGDTGFQQSEPKRKVFAGEKIKKAWIMSQDFKTLSLKSYLATDTPAPTSPSTPSSPSPPHTKRHIDFSPWKLKKKISTFLHTSCMLAWEWLFQGNLYTGRRDVHFSTNCRLGS